MIAVYLGLLLAWTLVCCLAGAVWEAYWEDVRDMDQRDQWATETEQRMAHEQRMKGAA